MSDAESTLQLLVKARSGDESALESLFARYAAPLRRWAHGRLPRWARDVADTPDLVQDVLLQTFKRLEHFDPRTEDALQAYLRQSLMNRVRDELRESDRDAIVGRLELGLSYDELAELLGKPSPDAARKAAQRALVRLVDDMKHGR